MKRFLSIYDFTGNWPEFFMDAGHDVILWDLKHGRDALTLDSVETCLDEFEFIDGILAAVPCTDFTNSGAQYWNKKDREGLTAKSIALVYQVLKLVDLFAPTDPDYEEGFFWVIENPVGRLTQLFPELGKPYYFHPHEFAGHLNLSSADHNELDRIRRKDAIGITKEEVEFVVNCNAYTKKTGLWGDFNRQLVKNNVEPVRLCKQGSFTQLLGGKSERTKEMRSMTPRGFAKSFYDAQLSNNYKQLNFFS